MFVELKRFFDGHSELESSYFLAMVAKPDSDIAAFSLFLAIRSFVLAQDHARAVASIDMLLAQFPAEASLEDREYLRSLKTECERMTSTPPVQR